MVRKKEIYIFFIFWEHNYIIFHRLSERQPKADQTNFIIMNALIDWKMSVLWSQIVQEMLKQFPGPQTGKPTHQRPRLADLLFYFDVGRTPTTLVQL